MARRDILCVLIVAVAAFLGQTCWASEDGKIRVISDWKEDDQPIRVDCSNIEIVGDGFGGSQLSCADRLSLYALFNCFPMKKCVVEATCPEWDGLEAEIDWERVAQLIDEQQGERAAEEEKLREELARLAREQKERQDSDK